MMNCTTRDYELADQAGHRYRLDSNLERLSLCLSFMRLVVESDMNARLTRGRRSWPARELLTELADHRDWLHGYWRLFRRHYTLHPYVVLFLRTYREHAIRQLDGLSLGGSSKTGATVEDVFEDFVLQMRSEAKRCCLRKRAADWQGKHDRNADRLIDLMVEVGRRSQYLTVIELELDYSASRVTREEAEQIATSANQVMEAEADAYWSGWNLDRIEHQRVKVLFEEVQRDRKRLFANLKGKSTLFRSLRGYVWRVQFTPVAGYGLGLSLIFDRMEEGRVDLGHEIGRYWSESITQGRGCYRQLEPWPALATARRIAAFGCNAGTEQKELRRKLMSQMGGPLLAVQVLPHTGCNLTGTGFVHPKAGKQRGNSGCLPQPTRAAAGDARIQNRHLLGVTASCTSSATGELTMVGEPVAEKEGGGRAPELAERRGR